MRSKRQVLALLLCLVVLLTAGGELCLSAFAVETGERQYSSVLDDLQKDPAFDAADYPIIPGDSSLRVLHLAESKDGEVLVYVYQPGGTKVATCVNMSLNYGDYAFYTLSLIQKDGVFFKYKIDNLSVSSEEKRVYDLVSILRPWEEGVDLPADMVTENTINEAAFKVGRSFVYSGVDGLISLKVEDLDVVTVTGKYVGFMRYPAGQGFLFSDYDCDVHFVAFSTDKKIENLLTADVYYEIQSYEEIGLVSTPEYGQIEKKYVRLTAMVDFEYDGHGWFAPSYSWKKIQTSADFLNSEEAGYMYQAGVFNVNVQSLVNDAAKETIASHEWVLRFALTEYHEWEGGTPTFPRTLHSYSIVGNVSLVRLAFETDGVYYDLGVVDNKQTGSGSPVNDIDIKVELQEMWEMIISLLFLVLLLCLAGPFIMPILTLFWRVLRCAFKGVFSLLLFVLKLPWKLCRRKK